MMRWFALVLTFIVMSAAGHSSARPADPLFHRAGYFCNTSVDEPTIVDACGTSVCRYEISCLDARTNDIIDGHAYCPLRAGGCAPYTDCNVPNADTSSQVMRRFEAQCDRFRSSAPAEEDGWGT